ncbi:MAG: type I-E CRISPR-associated protein Cas7/Cse4/CasC [Proteobacteria bacterium]|nr:type I-E CRISPR-associated protein Cas7/Cse4/CasC [Pseudomonadota bacterium]
MKHFELHIIQSVPVACLNRDDLNSPKTAMFGGVQRARVSSQSWKRAIRELAKEIAPERFRGERTRLLYEPLKQALENEGLSSNDAEKGAEEIVDALVKIDKKSKDKVKSTTLYFMSPQECETLAKAYKESQNAKKALKKVTAEAFNDAADISIFGRMVANDHSLTVEGAAMFSHALSTHRADNEIDFFSAVDDLQPKEEAGAGMTGTLEFNSATYYRFAALNLDMLADEGHLGALSQEERQAVVAAFIEATIKAIPSARKNTMNANTMPAYVLGVVRNEGHPVQLVNAFEKSLPSSAKGYTQESIESLRAEYQKLKETWDITAVFEKAIPTDLNFRTFIEEVIRHVP